MSKLFVALATASGWSCGAPDRGMRTEALNAPDVAERTASSVSHEVAYLNVVPCTCGVCERPGVTAAMNAVVVAKSGHLWARGGQG